MNKKLAHIASYLEVTAEGWLEWTETKRVHYISKFDKLSVKDLAKGKNIPEGKEQHEDQESLEYQELPKDDITSLYDTSSLAELIKTIVKGAWCNWREHTPHALPACVWMPQEDPRYRD